jgi:hypothetical protein
MNVFKENLNNLEEINNPAWRFLNLEEFLFILTNRKLHIPNASLFEDPYEGFIPSVEKVLNNLSKVIDYNLHKIFDIKIDNFGSDDIKKIKKILTDFLNLGNSNLSLSYYKKIRPHLENYIEQQSTFSKSQLLNLLYLNYFEPLLKLFPNHHKYYCGISSWYLSDTESAAMWKLHTNGKNGIAIKINSNKLSKYFEENCKNQNYRFIIKKIEYLNNYHQYINKLINYDIKKVYKSHDNEEDPFYPFLQNIFNIYFLKRESFSFEKEMRLLVYPPINQNSIETFLKNPEKSGYAIEFDLNIISPEILISPVAELWYVDMIKEIIGKFTNNLKVYKSNLYEIND